MGKRINPRREAVDAPQVRAGSPLQPARRLNRRQFLTALGTGLAGCAVASSVYANGIEPFWVEYPEHDMPLRDLPDAFVGMRVAHLSDLHCSRLVPRSHLEAVIDQVNARTPDLVVITGDLLTGDADYIPQLTQVLSECHAPVFAVLGNHDYTFGRIAPGQRRLEAQLHEALDQHGITVLRNHAYPIQRGRDRLWLAGFEDIWARRYNHRRVLTPIPTGEPTIALVHNPDAAAFLDERPVQWILSGHTHGGQIRIPLLGAIQVPTRRSQWCAGRFALKHSCLYVSRGIGYSHRLRLNCRPEVPIFTLRHA